MSFYGKNLAPLPEHVSNPLQVVDGIQALQLCLVRGALRQWECENVRLLLSFRPWPLCLTRQVRLMDHYMTEGESRRTLRHGWNDLPEEARRLRQKAPISGGGLGHCG